MKKLLLTLSLAALALSASAADKLMVIGDATWGGWSLDNASVMNATADNVFEYYGHLDANKEFKFLTACEWGQPEYRATEADKIANNGKCALVLAQGDANDLKFKVTESANYHITADLNTLELTVEKIAFQDAEILHNSLWLVGSATPGQWNLPEALPLSWSIDDIYGFSGEVHLVPGEFKIGVNPYGGYGQTFYHPTAANNAELTPDGTDDRKWYITTEGIYTITLNLGTCKFDISDPAGISLVEVDEAPAESYNLQGIRVANPARGIFIRRQGTTVSKVLVK